MTKIILLSFLETRCILIKLYITYLLSGSTATLLSLLVALSQPQRKRHEHWEKASETCDVWCARLLLSFYRDQNDAAW